MADRLIPIRTVNHNVIDEHAAATNRKHTGRLPSGSVVYPSIGSISHRAQSAAEACPHYIVHGLSERHARPGFLGPKSGYVYLTDTRAVPPA